MSQKEEVSPEQQLHSKAVKGPHTNLGNSIGQDHDSDSCACQEGLDQARRDGTKDKPKLKSVVKKPDLPAIPAVSPAKGTSQLAPP